MNTDVSLFQFDAMPVRAVHVGTEPWFVASDVASILGFRSAPDMTRNLDDDEKGTHKVRTLGGEQDQTIISESGLYTAILRANRPEAKRFRKWVTGEVLPAIRRTGGYQRRDAGLSASDVRAHQVRMAVLRELDARPPPNAVRRAALHEQLVNASAVIGLSAPPLEAFEPEALRDPSEATRRLFWHAINTLESTGHVDLNHARSLHEVAYHLPTIVSLAVKLGMMLPGPRALGQALSTDPRYIVHNSSVNSRFHAEKRTVRCARFRSS